MRGFTATMLFFCAALAFAPADAAWATSVVIERGAISGRARLAPIFTGNLPTATATFTLEPGDEDVPGLDYASISPGAFSLVINPFTYVWSGSFNAPADMSLIDFEVGTSSFTTTIFGLSVVVGDTLDFSPPPFLR
ncbi:MAG: hypothetical protein Q8R92_18155 [Deltaproteobacteria bacterium]|nr:hypothetical protein [Deltaproteobacteria bacterium]